MLKVLEKDSQINQFPDVTEFGASSDMEETAKIAADEFFSLLRTLLVDGSVLSIAGLVTTYNIYLKSKVHQQSCLVRL